MGAKRVIDKFMSVFDLRIGRTLNLPASVSTRVMFIYDKKANTQEFKVLNTELPRHMNTKITSWLKENIQIDDILYGMNSNRMDADTYPH
jgi:hypothetical protein